MEEVQNSSRVYADIMCEWSLSVFLPVAGPPEVVGLEAALAHRLQEVQEVPRRRPRREVLRQPRQERHVHLLTNVVSIDA